MRREYQHSQEHESSEDAKRLKILEERTYKEFASLGIDTNVCKKIESLYVRNNEGMLNIAGHKVEVEIEFKNQQYKTEAHLKYQFNWKDGSKRNWDSMTYIIPYSFYRNSKAILLPPEVNVLGYQVMQKDYLKTEKIPNVRIDSVCIPSMFMGGHRATEHNEELGCDCLFQKDAGHEEIHKKSGIGIISPFEGRGNGLIIHTGQLMLQWSAYRYGERVPDTYEAVESLGAPKDSRGDFYPLDILIFRMFGDPKKINLLTNNPEKIDTFYALGIEVDIQPHHAQESSEYYNGPNYQAKVTNGHRESKTIYKSNKL